MTITFDGERSKQRKVLAKKWLNDLVMLDLPAKNVVYDGFHYRLFNLDDDLKGGRITAPAGALVAYSTSTKVEIASSDWWAGAFNANRPAYILKAVETVSGTQIGSTISGVQGGELDRVAYNPSVYGVGTPVAFSFANEHYVFGITGTHDSTGAFIHLGSSLYADSGSAKKSLIYSEYVDSTAFNRQYFGCVTTIRTNGGLSLFSVPGYLSASWYLENTANRPYLVGTLFLMAGEGTVALAEIDVALYYASLHSDIKNPLSYYDYKISGQGPAYLRTYGYALESYLVDETFPTTAQLIRADNISFPPAHDSTEYDLMLAIVNWTGSVSGILLYLSNLETFCNNMFGAAARTVDDITVILLKYFGYPCARMSAWTAADTVFVPVDANTFYSWTRSDGVVKFSTSTGITKYVGFQVPALVSSTPGLRPNITQSELGRYFCVCETTSGVSKVLGIYTGSPFTGWTALPMPSTGDLLHARPIKNSATEAIVLGVVETLDGYFFTVLRYVNDGQQFYGDWIQLGKLPFADDATAKWGVGLYGIDPWIKYQQDYMQPPPIVHGDVS